jgi:hypothetical protein
MNTRLRLPQTPRRPGRSRTAVRAPAETGPELEARPGPEAPPGPSASLEPHALLEPDAPLQPEPLQPDVDACKVREAGGPLDEAAYVCACGVAFAAAVSTSVQCPHCGSPQAW